MRYIRTKEGKIIDVEKRYKEHLESGWFEKKIKPVETFIKISHHNIIDQADNIHDLCDLEVIWIKGRKYPILERIVRGVMFIHDHELIEKVFLGIWTPKGLTYVAEQDNKGVARLL